MEINTIYGDKYIIYDINAITPEGVINIYYTDRIIPFTTEIQKLNMIKSFNCFHYEIETLEPISNLINLQELDCSSNEIETLEPISNLFNLQKLDCSGNEIETLEPISNLINLQILECSYNQLTILEPIMQLTNLLELDCSINRLTSLEPISGLTNLQILDCSNNRIETLEPISNLINLKRLWCNNNRLTSLPLFLVLAKLKNFKYDNNEIDYIPRPIQRLIKRLENRYNKRNIYNDGQNVHNHHIQECVRTSINNIFTYETKMKEETLKSEILEDDILEETTKRVLFEYIDNKDEHSVIGCSFEDLMIQVWSIIKEHPESNEIKRILNSEMSDSLCKCFTGRLSRLVNVLNGYSDLVSITISDSEQKNMIMSIGIRTYDNREELEEYIRNEFEERGFNDVEEWLGYLDEL